MKSFITIKILFLCLIMQSTLILAAGGLKGVVTDSLSGETLYGANLILLETALGAATNMEGVYSIKGIPPGDYTLRVSYIGYQSETTDVTIQDNRTLELNFNLFPDIIRGEDVVITGQALGQAAAINQQLTSNTIINVVSEEKIQELPDANAAEAIGRLTGCFCN